MKYVYIWVSGYDTTIFYNTFLVNKVLDLQYYFTSLSHYSVVKVSQVLFSVECVCETTLDEIEEIGVPLDEKKTTLLCAIYTSVSLDHDKLKVLTTVLSKFDTEGLSNSDYGM